MSFIDNSFQFLDRQCRLRHQAPFVVHPRPVRHVHLDPVRTMIQLLPRRLARLHRPVDELRALGHVQLWRIAFQVVPAGRGNRARRAKQPRSGNRPLFDGLLDFDVSVARALGLEVAQRRKPLL